MIDLHSHILAGIDDGPQSLAESVEIARAAVADGITVIAATPHVRNDYPTTPETMRAKLTELHSALHEAGVSLEVIPGGEVALDHLSKLSTEDLRQFALAGSAQYLLLEFPYYGWPLELATRIQELTSVGITPILAHPERNGDVQADPERLRPLVEAGALVQVTAASLDGRLGRRARGTALALIRAQLAHLVASDAHTPAVRGVGMSDAAEAIGDDVLARWLTHTVPTAILQGEALPPRPLARQPASAASSKRLGNAALTLAVAAAVFWIAYDGATYGLTSRNTLAVAIWWTIALGIALGLLPRARVDGTAWIAGILFATFATWTAASLAWAESEERAFNEFNRVTLYLGVFTLAALVATQATAHLFATGIALGISGIALLALTSRLLPSVVEEEPLVPLLGTDLSYPLDYSNGLGIFVALGIPLLLAGAVEGRLAARGLAIGLIPPAAAVIDLTSSRGVMLAAGVGTTALVALARHRWRVIAAIAFAAPGAAVVIALLEATPELAVGPLPRDAEHTGRVAAAIVGLASVATGILYSFGARVLRVPTPPKAASRGVLAVLSVGAVAGLTVVDPVARFESFKEAPAVTAATPLERARRFEANSSGRWQYWQVARKQFVEAPVRGQGAGSYEAWWAQHRTLPLFARDAHSLYLETLGELGAIGLILLLGALSVAAGAALVRARARQMRSDVPVALLATFIAWATAAALDWMWELTAVTVVAVTCLGVCLAGQAKSRRRLLPQVALIAVAASVVCGQLIPLLRSTEVRASETAAARGEADSALEHAVAARAVQPWAASPHLQLALVREEFDLAGARAAVLVAIERDGRDWRLWLVRARIETKLARVAEAKKSLRRAVELNPRSPLFAELSP